MESRVKMNRKETHLSKQGPSQLMTPSFSSPLYPGELLNVDQVLIKEKANGLYGGNKYVIMTADNNVILTAEEEGNVFFGTGPRNIRMSIINNKGVEVLTLHRPWRWTFSKMEVHMGGQLISIVRHKGAWFHTVININDSSDNTVLKVKGPSIDRTLEIQTLDQSVVGGVSKLGGLMKELFARLDTFVVTFPADLDVRYKSAVIGACILIDYVIYKKR